MGILVIVLVFSALGLAAFVVDTICRHKAERDMVKRGYKREFVIACSADPGSWQWVKK